MSRDIQRSRVYAWERACLAEMIRRDIYNPEFKTLEECAAFANPIWMKERGRYGRANIAPPLIERPAWGQRRALAHHGDRLVARPGGGWRRNGGRITLPRWARSRWVVLHELAHRLVGDDARSRGGAHGPRFVGILVGLAARWLQMDADWMLSRADEDGVRVDRRAVGAYPVRGPSWHVERVVRQFGPMTAGELAAHLTLYDGIETTPKQVRGAALSLIGRGQSRWYRRKLVLLPAGPKRQSAHQHA